MQAEEPEQVQAWAQALQEDNQLISPGKQSFQINKKRLLTPDPEECLGGALSQRVSGLADIFPSIFQVDILDGEAGSECFRDESDIDALGGSHFQSIVVPL